MKYLKLWTSFRDIMQPLSDDEKGRLFDAMLTYADSFEEPVFSGNERFVWPSAKQWIDLTYSESLRLSQNGKKGGRPKTNANQQKPTQTNDNQQKPTQSHKVKENNVNVKEDNITSSFIDDDDAFRIQHEHDAVLEAARNAGFKCTPSETADLIKLYADYGYDRMAAGFTACVDHSAPNLAYLRAVLNGTGKKKPAVKVLPAQQYEQRDYSGVQDELSAQQDLEMQEYIRNRGAC